MRTTIVSTSKIKTYKIITLSIITAITLFVLFLAVYSAFILKEYHQFLILPVYVMFAYQAIPAILKIKNVSYDDSSVYYDRKGYEVQIPFEDIKNIEIMTISGIYKIILFDPTQDGLVIRFKTSLWYPFNFRRQDEKVNELIDKIDKYKSTLYERNMAELPSFKI